MDKKKRAKRIKLGIYAFMALFLISFAFHYTLVSDANHGKGAPPGRITISTTAEEGSADVTALRVKIFGQEEEVGVYEIITTTFTHMLTKPFSFGGLVLSHTATPLAVIGVLVAFAIFQSTNKKKMYQQDRAGEESGSAKWFNDFEAYNAEFVDPYTKADIKAGIPDNNILLAQGLKLSMNTRKTQRNLNVLAVGGSGAGKTYRLIKPNLAQMNCSYVVTDPSGEIMQAEGVMLMEEGYRLRLFSTSDMKHSNAYNPMDYIYDEYGDVDQVKVGILVSTFIKNASDLKKNSGGDPFWTKSSTAWMTFAVLFLAEFSPIENRNLYHVLKLAQMGKTDEGNNASQQTPLDSVVASAERKNPKAKCFSSYKTFKLAPAKTANSILISMAVDLNAFSMDDVRNLTTTSYLCTRNKQGQIVKYIRDSKGVPIRDSRNLDLETIGDVPTALFVNIPQANGAFNFLVSMMYSQLFNTLYTRAEKVSPNRYHIYDANGRILSSQYKTQEEAEQALALYSQAEIIEETEKKTEVTHYYIYNKEAKRKETIPEMAVKRKYGYMEEVYSRESGEKLLARYRKAKGIPLVSGKKGLPGLPKKSEEVQKPAKNGPYVARGRLRLPIHTRFLLDEFNNIGEIPDFDTMLSTMRKYEISCTIILQSLSQIKAKYDKVWESLLGNCDSIVFLGSSENETDKYISEKLGKQTIKTIDHSQSQSSNSSSVSTSFKKQARDLLDAAEVGKLNNKESIVLIRGLNPFLLKKLEFNQHPNYKKTGDYDPSRIVDEAYLETHFKCLNKETIDEDEIRSEEDHQREIAIDARKNPEQKKGHPVKNGKDLADAVGVPEEKLAGEMKKARSVDPADYETHAGISIADSADADPYLMEDPEPDDTPHSGGDAGQEEPTVETSAEGPEMDGDSWFFT